MQRPVIKGIRLRLSLALVLVVAGVLAVVYLTVVPSLETELVNAKLDQLEEDARKIALDYQTNRSADQDFAAQAGALFSARVVIYTKLERIVLIHGDSSTTDSRDVERDPIVLEAAANGKLHRGTVERDGRLFAEVALPAGPGAVVLVSDSLADPLSSLHLIERRLFIAGVIGLLFAIVAGYALATMHARRIRRLERAAERIAGGAFDEPVVDTGQDELGELAAAFERMRIRLEMLDRARREFIANASHELRTPLFSLAGFLELMADEELDEATRQEFLETMREQVDRLAKLATDLLDLSRLDAGRMRVEHEPVDLDAVAQLVAEEFAAVAERKNHALDVVVEGRPIARADELRMLQVCRALVDNALVHTPPGSRVTLRAYADREHAYLEVEDDGPGVPAEHAPHVFDRFYRAEGGVASGSGLGLAIARELVTFMDGEVELESEPGRTRRTGRARRRADLGGITSRRRARFHVKTGVATLRLCDPPLLPSSHSWQQRWARPPSCSSAPSAGWIGEDEGARTVVVETDAGRDRRDQDAVASARKRLRSGEDLRRPLGRRRHDLLVLQQRPALAGLRLRRLGRGSRAHELARGHGRRRGQDGPRRFPRLRPVCRRRPHPRRDRRLGPVQRHRRRQDRSTRPRGFAAAAR